MTGIEKSIIIVLFALIFIVLGFIILWMVSFYRDRKRDRENIKLIYGLESNILNQQENEIGQLFQMCEDLTKEIDKLKKKRKDKELTE